VQEAKTSSTKASSVRSEQLLLAKSEFEKIDFVVVSRGSAVESDFCTKLKTIDVQEEKKDKLCADHMTQVYKRTIG